MCRDSNYARKRRVVVLNGSQTNVQNLGNVAMIVEVRGRGVVRGMEREQGNRRDGGARQRDSGEKKKEREGGSK